ncbi:hypothetical protein AVEN_115235-1 [Araneus ventricosus]|uniref:Uncharacterized protein n=1 Tax=Araneus ventricosus TaxID=182803 RepID=A0A4Y1ZXS0_ARAVE|nr:hypothetical protein AVEN_115235-1 [Araneus ventricosus]
MTRTTPELEPPLQTSAPVQREDVPLLTYDLQQAQYTMDLQWNRVSNLECSDPEAETLALDHSGPTVSVLRRQRSHCERIETTAVPL